MNRLRKAITTTAVILGPMAFLVIETAGYRLP
jgi:hypothetical protein